MKRILIVFLVLILFLTGCTSNDLSKEKETYLKYIKELRNINKSTKEVPFNIEVRFDKITDDEIRYQVVIDEVKEDITDVEAIAIHDKQTDDVFPSIGIFDKKQRLEVGKKPSGIILVGYIDYLGKVEKFKCNLKILIKYNTNDRKSHTVYYVTKK